MGWRDKIFSSDSPQEPDDQEVEEERACAVVFGYKQVDELLRDLGFVRYLAFLDYNQPIGWRIHSPR